MTRDDIQLLFAYDRWANDRVLQAASALSDDKFTRDLGGAFASVRDTLVHILSGEWTWLTFWAAYLEDPTPAAALLADVRARRTEQFNPALFPGLAAVASKWAEVQSQQIGFIDSLTDERLRMMVPYSTTQVPLAQLMQHLANHSTYHRGQIALMMRQLDTKPIATDFHVFLAEAGRQA